MSFEIRIELPKRQQIVAADDADFCPRRVQQRRGVPLREHESVVVGILRMMRVVAHFGEEERGGKFCGGAARRRVTAAGLRGGAHRIDTEARRDVLQRGYTRGRRHGDSLRARHYNDPMRALRYVYMLALVVWLGGMIVLGALVA